jgi:hypothetical protein
LDDIDSWAKESNGLGLVERLRAWKIILHESAVTCPEGHVASFVPRNGSGFGWEWRCRKVNSNGQRCSFRSAFTHNSVLSQTRIHADVFVKFCTLWASNFGIKQIMFLLRIAKATAACLSRLLRNMVMEKFFSWNEQIGTQQNR